MLTHLLLDFGGIIRLSINAVRATATTMTMTTYNEKNFIPAHWSTDQYCIITDDVNIHDQMHFWLQYMADTIFCIVVRQRMDASTKYGIAGFLCVTKNRLMLNDRLPNKCIRQQYH